MKNVFFVFALVCSLTALAQSDDKAAGMKALVESQNYVFQAQTVLPIHGRTRELTYDYDLKVTPDKIVSYLPYYGRAYTAVDPTKNVMDFTSKDFSYTITPAKKGGWQVLIKPKDQKENIQSVSLDISSEGYTSVHVIGTNTDAISYNGKIVAPK